MRLVHGRVTLSVPPHIKYGHAWIELDGKIVIDPEHQLKTTIEDYYEVGGVEEDSCIRYTYTEMARKVTEHNHWGPWDLEELPEEAEFRKEQTNDI